MRSVVLDKIASVTLNCQLAREVKVSDEYQCREGDVLAVRVLTRKSTYNTLELTTGRFSNVRPGDVIAGALGHRRALLGYAGHIPQKLATGDKINILNLGGVLGICTSVNPDLGSPFEVEVLGQVLHFPYLGERIGVPANIGHAVPPLDEVLDVRGVPIVAVVGTCMNAGKTQACQSLVQEFTRMRLSVMAAKATGVSLRRDILSMEDAGADRVHDARAVAPGHERQGERVAGHAAPHPRVEVVQARRAHGDPDLPGTGHGIGHVLKDQPVKTAMLPDQDGAHRGPPAPTPGPRRR